jgi:predicted transcriptional regulator
MTKSDDSILEVLNEFNGALSLRGIEVNSELLGRRVPYSTIQDRIPKLIDGELVETVDEHEQWYLITDEGSAYLEGDHTPPDLED